MATAQQITAKDRQGNPIPLTTANLTETLILDLADLVVTRWRSHIGDDMEPYATSGPLAEHTKVIRESLKTIRQPYIEQWQDLDADFADTYGWALGWDELRRIKDVAYVWTDDGDGMHPFLDLDETVRDAYETPKQGVQSDWGLVVASAVRQVLIEGVEAPAPRPEDRMRWMEEYWNAFVY